MTTTTFNTAPVSFVQPDRLPFGTAEADGDLGDAMVQLMEAQTLADALACDGAGQIPAHAMGAAISALITRACTAIEAEQVRGGESESGFWPHHQPDYIAVANECSTDVPVLTEEELLAA